MVLCKWIEDFNGILYCRFRQEEFHEGMCEECEKEHAERRKQLDETIEKIKNTDVTSLEDI